MAGHRHLIKTVLLTHPYVDVYTATPGNLERNGLPVHGSAGLELGLIRKYALPWNIRSAGLPMSGTRRLPAPTASPLISPDSGPRTRR